MWAAMRGHKEAVGVLLAHGANVEDQSNVSTKLYLPYVVLIKFVCCLYSILHYYIIN